MLGAEISGLVVRMSPDDQSCSPPPAWPLTPVCLLAQFKSFVNTAFKPTMYSPHRASFGVEGNASHLVDENGNRIPAGRNKQSTHAFASVYHYATKSQEVRRRG